MGIDSSIAMGVRPVQIESPMNALAQMMQIKQSQQANQLNGMKMDEYQRGVGETNRLNSLYSGSIGTDGKIDRVKLITGAASQNLGSKIPGLQKGFLETDESQGKVDKQKSELIDASLKRSRGYLDVVKTPDDYMAWHEANHRDPVLGPVLGARGITADSARASIIEALKKPGGFQELLNKSAMGIEKFSEMNKPSVHVQNLGDSSQMVSTPGMGGAPTVLSNTPINQSADSRASQATQIRGQNMTDSRARETNSIARDLGITKKELEIDKMREEATGRGNQKQAAIGSVKNQIAVIDKALEHKGRTTGTGLSGSLDPRNYIPGTNATDFKVVVDQIGGAAFLQAFESLKGGGQITEVEGKKATDAMARLNRSQSDEEFKVALTDLRKVMSDGLGRISAGEKVVNPIDSLLDKYK